MKSGKLNFLEPSGPFQACNGTVLSFSIYIMISVFEANPHQHVTECQMAFISQTHTSRRHLKQDYFTQYLSLRDFQPSMWRHRNFVENELVTVFSLVSFA
jgi:hypothetical protein